MFALFNSWHLLHQLRRVNICSPHFCFIFALLLRKKVPFYLGLSISYGFTSNICSYQCWYSFDLSTAESVNSELWFSSSSKTVFVHCKMYLNFPLSYLTLPVKRHMLLWCIAVLLPWTLQAGCCCSTQKSSWALGDSKVHWSLSGAGSSED